MDNGQKRRGGAGRPVERRRRPEGAGRDQNLRGQRRNSFEQRREGYGGAGYSGERYGEVSLDMLPPENIRHGGQRTVVRQEAAGIRKTAGARVNTGVNINAVRTGGAFDGSVKRKRRRRSGGFLRAVVAVLAVIGAITVLRGLFSLAGSAARWLEGSGIMTASGSYDNPEAPSQSEMEDFYRISVLEPEIQKDLLPVNVYSRPGERLDKVNNIFVHYTANPGTTAQQNRSYFASLAQTHETSASSHFIIGEDGTIIQCVPLDEIAYAVMKHNGDSISIECCYVDDNGRFTDKTYRKLIELTAWLMHKYKLTSADVLRHYDAGGKPCPKYYVDHEEAWETFIEDLDRYIGQKLNGKGFA